MSQQSPYRPTTCHQMTSTNHPHVPTPNKELQTNDNDTNDENHDDNDIPTMIPAAATEEERHMNDSTMPPQSRRIITTTTTNTMMMNSMMMMPPPPSRTVTTTTTPPRTTTRTTNTNTNTTTTRTPADIAMGRRIQTSTTTTTNNFGLSDWMRLLSVSKDMAQLHGQAIRRNITIPEVQQHSSVHDGWIILHHSHVYNLSPYLPYHPGGKNILKSVLGKDATILFHKYHPWVNIDGYVSTCVCVSVMVSYLFYIYTYIYIYICIFIGIDVICNCCFVLF